MKILVTGAAGFIGFHLAKRLLVAGHEVYGIDNINAYYDVHLKYARLQELGVDKEEAAFFYEQCESTSESRLKFMRINLEDKKELNTLFENEKFDIVCNLAAQAGVRYSIENPDAYIQSNIVGFLNILECCRNHAVKQLLYASSSSVYGENKKVPFSTADAVDHPISLYAATKKSNELMAHTYSHLYKLPTIGMRFFTVYGPWGRPDMAPMLFADAISKGKPIKVFNNGNMSRDFTYIDDIVNGIQVLIQKKDIIKQEEEPKEYYRLYNIGNGTPQPLGDFIKAIENSFGEEAKKDFLPMQAGDVPRTWADVSEIEKLGYKSTMQLEEGIQKFVAWFQTYYKTAKSS